MHRGIFVNFHQILVVYYILDYFGILFILDINSVLREFILWNQSLLKGLFCEKIWGTKVLLNYIFSVLNFVLIFFVHKYWKYLKLVAGFTFNSFSLRLARNMLQTSRTEISRTLQRTRQRQRVPSHLCLVHLRRTRTLRPLLKYQTVSSCHLSLGLVPFTNWPCWHFQAQKPHQLNAQAAEQKRPWGHQRKQQKRLIAWIRFLRRVLRM